MTTHVRRLALATLLVLGFVGLAIAHGSAQQAAGQGAAGAPTPSPAPSPVVRPEAQALTAAAGIADPAARIAALEKIRTDFPQATNLAVVDQQLLTALANNFPDRAAAITETFDRIIARIPAEAAPETRLAQLNTPIRLLAPKKLLLDKSEALVTSALAAFDPEKYAQTMRDSAKRASRPEPPQAQIDSSIGTIRGGGLETLARVYLGKGDEAKAIETFKESVKANPAFGTATQALLDLYAAKNDFASAESVLKDSIKAASTPAVASRSQQALADLYIKKGDDAAAEGLLKEILKSNATLATALVPLARLEAKRGDHAAALDHFLTAAVAGSLKPADDATLKSLWARTHNGSDAGLEAAIDKAYLDKFPNPVTPEKYTPTPARTNKVVLLEMFTGSGCPPCVASDLALDAAMVRYADHIISLVYHEHIPQPDPMVAANNNDRRLYYSVSGVPTFEIDGAMVANPMGTNPGGGARTNTGPVYNAYTASIDKFLEMPARAALSVNAVGEGDQVSVTVNVTSLPAEARDLRLHIVLAEKELKFTGENGIRFHPMVVRATVGDKGAGLPITTTGATKHVFSLSTIKDEITKSLAAEMEKRRKAEAPGSTPREYAAEVRGPYTAINTHELVVVAFLQEGPYRAPKPAPAPAPAPSPTATAAAGATQPPAQVRNAADPALANILNAAKANVVFAPASAAKGGGR